MSACIEPPVPKLFYHEFRFDEPSVPKLFYNEFMRRFDEKRYTVSVQTLQSHRFLKFSIMNLDLTRNATQCLYRLTEPPVPKIFYHEFRFDEKRYTSACIEPPVPKLFFAQLDALNDCLVIENLEKVTLSLLKDTMKCLRFL
jgi:hypothetical protein